MQKAVNLKLEQLDAAIEKYTKDQENTQKLKRDYEAMVRKQKVEQRDLDSKKKKDVEEFEKYKEAEMEKVKKEREDERQKHMDEVKKMKDDAMVTSLLIASKEQSLEKVGKDGKPLLEEKKEERDGSIEITAG